MTDSPCADEARIGEWWDDPQRKDIKLTNQWTGKTVFEVLPDPKDVPAGYEMVLGRLTRKHASTRPPRIMPEMWNAMTKRQKRDAITIFEKDKLRRKEIGIEITCSTC